MNDYRSIALIAISAAAAVGGLVILRREYRRRGVVDEEPPLVSEEEEEKAEAVVESIQEEDDSEEEKEEEVDVSSNENGTIRFVVHAGSLLLTIFALLHLLSVLTIALIYTNLDDSINSPTEYPLFGPLIWTGLGILVASLTGVDTQVDSRFLHLDYLKKTLGSDPDAAERASVPPIDNDRTRSERRRPARRAEAVMDDPVLSIDFVENLYKEGKHGEIRAYLKKMRRSHPDNTEYLWRLARACNDMIELTSNEEQKKALAYEGLEYATDAVEKDENGADAHKWMAIMTSSSGKFKSTKDKIAGAYIIRNHIQRAIALNPHDATSRNILGQWCLALADMTWIERRAAATLFGTPPSATYDQALEQFLAAEQISPGFWKLNAYLIAETYSKLKNSDSAKEWLEKAKQVPVVTREDREVEEKIVILQGNL